MINWKKDFLKFKQTFWVIRDTERGVENLTGVIQFNICCKRLSSKDKQKGFQENVNVLKKRCGNLMKDLSKKYHLTHREILEIVVGEMMNKLVDFNTLETDNDRIKLLSKRQVFFDKYSVEL